MKADLKAVNNIHEALRGLPPVDQKRVMETVWKLLGLNDVEDEEEADDAPDE